MTEETSTGAGSITPADYARILREAARMRGTFTVNGRDAVAAKELADAGMLLAKPGLDSRGFPVAAGIMGITVKGREWLDAPERERREREETDARRRSDNAFQAHIARKTALWAFFGGVLASLVGALSTWGLSKMDRNGRGDDYRCRCPVSVVASATAPAVKRPCTSRGVDVPGERKQDAEGDAKERGCKEPVDEHDDVKAPVGLVDEAPSVFPVVVAHGGLPLCEDSPDGVGDEEPGPRPCDEAENNAEHHVERVGFNEKPVSGASGEVVEELSFHDKARTVKAEGGAP